VGLKEAITMPFCSKVAILEGTPNITLLHQPTGYAMHKYLMILPLMLMSFSAYALEATELKAKLPDDVVLGKAKAKVTIIEYASLSCPHCAAFHNDVLPTLQKEYIDTGKVRLIYRDLPLNAPALMAAKVSRCVAKLGGERKYYPLLKELFAKQNEWSTSKDHKEKLLAIGKQQGVEEKALNNCVDDKESETKIIASRKEANDKLAISSTPSFMINGEKVERLNDITSFRKALDTALSGKSINEQMKEDAKRALTAKPEDMVIGKPDAKATLIEYSNVGCAHCGAFHQSLVTGLKEQLEDGKVKIIYREMPKSQAAFYAFMVARCKGKDAYFDTLDMLIASNESWTSNAAFLPPLKEVATKAGIEGDAFYRCLEDKGNESAILAHTQDTMNTLGINHSPSLFLNGEALKTQDVSEVITAISELQEGK